jgi:hypothetical protein
VTSPSWAKVNHFHCVNCLLDIYCFLGLPSVVRVPPAGVGQAPRQHQGCHADDNGWTDGWTDARTMAVGSSVTWTHCSIRYEVTWGKKARICEDTPLRPHGHERIRANAPLCPRGHRSVRADEVISLPSPSLFTPSLALHGRAVASARTCEKINKL